MDNRQFDEKMRKALYDAEVPADDGIWAAVNASLRRRKARRLFYYLAPVAAVLVAALVLFAPNPEKSHTSSTVAALTEQPMRKTSTEPTAREGFETSIESVSACAVRAAGAVEAALVEKPPVPSGDTAHGPLILETTETGSDDGKQVTAVSSESEEKGPEVSPTQLFNLKDLEEDVTGISFSKPDRFSAALSSNLSSGGNVNISRNLLGSASSGTGGPAFNSQIEQISNTKHSLPLNLGVQFQFRLGRHVSIGTGVGYTLLHSKCDGLINKKKYNVRQTLHYVGIPLNVYGYLVNRNRFMFYVNAGVALEKGVRASYLFKSYDETLKAHSSIKGVEFSVNCGIGVEYLVGGKTGLYLEPNLVYFTNSTIERSIRTEQPLQIRAELGCRFHF